VGCRFGTVGDFLAGPFIFFLNVCAVVLVFNVCTRFWLLSAILGVDFLSGQRHNTYCIFIHVKAEVLQVCILNLVRFFWKTTAIISLHACPGLTIRYWFWFPRIGFLLPILCALGSGVQIHGARILHSSTFSI
jgi:hypothetical protein